MDVIRIIKKFSIAFLKKNSTLQKENNKIRENDKTDANPSLSVETVQSEFTGYENASETEKVEQCNATSVSECQPTEDIRSNDDEKTTEEAETLEIPTKKVLTLDYNINYNDEGNPISLNLYPSEADASINFSFEGEEKETTYTGEIPIERNCTLKAIVAKDGYESLVIEIPINIFKVPKPTLREKNGIVVIANVNKGIKYYYTTDGSIPSSDSSVYEDKVLIQKPTTIKVIGIKDGWKNSDCATIFVSLSPNERTREFTSLPNVLGISYQGDSHAKAQKQIKCQDFHSFAKINDNWSIAVVSDGAGSKTKSDVGSKAVCVAFTFYISELLKKDNRFLEGEIPNEKVWDIEFRTILYLFQQDIKTKLVNEKDSFESFSATIIVLVFSPKGYMVAHVGDGRAGVKVKGEWKSILTPHKGEEVNQTIFSTTLDYSKHQNLMMSGIYVPETSVSTDSIESFVLMSDGCENGTWLTFQRRELPDGDFKVEDVNLPRAIVLDKLLELLDISDETERKASLIDFITQYKELVREGDDKTILIGRV